MGKGGFSLETLHLTDDFMSKTRPRVLSFPLEPETRFLPVCLVVKPKMAR
jgi:hypothetical protein